MGEQKRNDDPNENKKEIQQQKMVGMESSPLAPPTPGKRGEDGTKPPFSSASSTFGYVGGGSGKKEGKAQKMLIQGAEGEEESSRRKEELNVHDERRTIPHHAKDDGARTVAGVGVGTVIISDTNQLVRGTEQEQNGNESILMPSFTPSVSGSVSDSSSSFPSSPPSVSNVSRTDLPVSGTGSKEEEAQFKEQKEIIDDSKEVVTRSDADQEERRRGIWNQNNNNNNNEKRNSAEIFSFLSSFSPDHLIGYLSFSFSLIFLLLTLFFHSFPSSSYFPSSPSPSHASQSLLLSLYPEWDRKLQPERMSFMSDSEGRGRERRK